MSSSLSLFSWGVRTVSLKGGRLFSQSASLGHQADSTHTSLSLPSWKKQFSSPQEPSAVRETWAFKSFILLIFPVYVHMHLSLCVYRYLYALV